MIQVKNEDGVFVELAKGVELKNKQLYRKSVGNPKNPGWVEKMCVIPTALTEIKIMSITNDIKHNGALTRVTCNELTNVIISGTLDYPDTLFAMPIRRDDGRLFLFPAQITNGAFSVVINLPTSGQFVYSDEECNIDLPTPLFTVKTLRIDCLRKIDIS